MICKKNERDAMVKIGFFPWFQTVMVEELPRSGVLESKSAEWDDPHPAEQPRANLGINKYIDMMGFDVSKDAEDWMANVKKHIAEAGYPEGSIKGAFAGIVSTYESYKYPSHEGIHYCGAEVLQSWERNDMAKNIRNAMEVIREGCGECRASTLLFATTLSKLGLRAAVFTTRVHVIPGVIAGKSGIDGMEGFKINDYTYFYPIEATFSAYDDPYNVDQQIQRGEQFFKDGFYGHQIPDPDDPTKKKTLSGLFYGILIDVDGNILWAERDQPDRKPLFMVPGIPLPTIEPQRQ